jgi:hypothetical protein
LEKRRTLIIFHLSPQEKYQPSENRDTDSRNCEAATGPALGLSFRAYVAEEGAASGYEK